MWTTLGYLTGTNIGPIYEQVSRYQFYFLIAATVLIVAFVLWRLLRDRHRSTLRTNSTDNAEADP